MEKIKNLIAEELSTAKEKQREQREAINAWNANLHNENWKWSRDVLLYNIKEAEKEIHRLSGVVKTLEWILGDEIKRMHDASLLTNKI